MFIQISPHDGVPIYRQIVNQVKYMVASGQLKTDDELPPIRTLASQILVTPNTVAKAYRELETEGVIYKRQGAGTYVSASGSPLAKREQRRIVSERIDNLLSEAQQLGFSLEDILELIQARQAELDRKH